jgi:hypothetical protein
MMTIEKNSKLFGMFDLISKKGAILLGAATVLALLFGGISVSSPKLLVDTKEATLNKVFMVKGSFAPNEIVEILVNNTVVATTSAKPDATFEASVESYLQEGKNTLSARSLGKSLQQKFGFMLGFLNTNSVLVEAKKPVLDITINTVELNKPIYVGTNVELRGKAPANTEICISRNGKQLIKTSADAEGNWKTKLNAGYEVGEDNVIATVCDNPNITSNATTITVFDGGK